MFTHVTACQLAAPPSEYVCLEGFDGFVTSTAAPIASGWSDKLAGWDLHPLGTCALSRRTDRRCSLDAFRAGRRGQGLSGRPPGTGQAACFEATALLVCAPFRFWRRPAAPVLGLLVALPNPPPGRFRLFIC